ncbi:lytic transglycosylase domain-containing protein [Deltaproteobacteria bacterium OttesenSCG-928-M10]|nr:lytic transglycosylase domain-containing protein [Deltaproteobacteria bacterium OttesenSCG-928-M10]
MSKAIVIFLLFFGGISIGPPLAAQMPVLELFEAPALELGVSRELTVAIAGVESGLSPWVLNIEGQPFRFDSKEKALEKAVEAWTAGQSFDLGLMQVNSQWLRRFDISPEAALDPLANVYFGSWILKQEIDRHGDIRAAIGAYHSPTPARASRYADQVMEALKRGPQPVKRSAGTSQKAVSVQEVSALASPAASGMLVASPKAGLAVPDSMKAAATLPEGSMKIKAK